MDFAFSESQVALRALAARILEHEVTLERLQEVEGGREWFDRKLWGELARANLLGVAVPEDVGGSGYGFVELCVLLEQVGRTVAPVPILPTLLGALAVAQFGTGDQRTRILPAVVAGDAVLSLALVEAGGDDPLIVRTTAEREGRGWRLEGEKIAVAAAQVADHLLVPARSDEGAALFLVDPGATGVELERQVAPSGEPLSRVGLTGVTVGDDDRLAAPGLLEWLVARATVALCALEVGVADRALTLTAEYTSQRVQFERPLATFQAVQQRAADAYIDVLAMRWCMWNAAWRLDEGLPADDDVAVAKFWASEAGHRVVSAAQHLHGGVGVDLSYPLHRYWLWSKQIEVTLGGATRQLARLGRGMAGVGPRAG